MATTGFLASCLFFQPQVITSAHGFQLGKEYRLVGVGIQPGGAIASVTPNPRHRSSRSRNFLGGKAISTVASGPEAGLQEKRAQTSKGKNTVNRPTCDMCTNTDVLMQEEMGILFQCKMWKRCVSTWGS